MKRKTPNSTIDEFFAASMKKSAPTITSSGSSNKDNIVIVKTASQKKVLQIEIPSLKQKETDIDKEYYEKKFSDISKSLIEGMDILFSGDFDQLNFKKLHDDVECFCRVKSSKDLFDNFLMPKLSSIIDDFIEKLSIQDQDIFQISKTIESFEDSLSNLRKIISYLDRAYIFAHRINGFLSISDIVHNQIRKIFLEQIKNEDHYDFTSRNKATLNLIIVQVKLQINLFRCSLDNEDDKEMKKKYQLPNNYIKENGRIIKQHDENNDCSSKTYASYNNSENDHEGEIDPGFKALSITLRFIDNLGLYESNVEDELIKQTEEFYSIISQELGLNQFLDRLSIAEDRESELLEAGVKVSTINYIFKSINQTALIDKQDILFGLEFQCAVDDRDDELIQKLYSFFDDPELRPIFSENLGKYFTSLANNVFRSGNEASMPSRSSPTRGRTIAESDKAEKNPFITNPNADIIVQLIDLYNNALEYVSNVFPDKQAILSAVRSQFDNYFSQSSETLSLLLAKHFAKGLPIEEKEIEFFKLIHAKDIFEASYFNLTKNRVLEWNHPINIDREKKLIDYLKEISGTMLIERLQTLVTDVEMSLKAERNVHTDRSIEFRAVALNWQNISNETFYDNAIYPSNIQHFMDSFSESFTREKSSAISKPQLHWSSKLSTVVGNIGNTTCQMTGDQALILLALQKNIADDYNDNSFSLEQIHEITGINNDTISNNLEVMCKKEAGFIIKTIGSDRFCINSESLFNSFTPLVKKGKKFVFPSIQSVIDAKQKEANESYVEVIKHNKIECSIMRKMKIFKTLSLSDLFARVKKDIGFEPDMEKFSEIVSNLVKKDFLERVNNKMIKYVVA